MTKEIAVEETIYEGKRVHLEEIVKKVTAINCFVGCNSCKSVT